MSRIIIGGCWREALLLIGICLVTPDRIAMAGDYYTPAPSGPVVKVGPDTMGATPVDKVFGKEYSHTDPTKVTDAEVDNIDDHNAFGVLDFLQVVSWDGLPGSSGGNSGSVDSFDFSVPGFNFADGQIDALANRNDALFRRVVRNEASLLYSMTGDAGTMSARVYWEDPIGSPGVHVWADLETPTGAGPGVNHHAFRDLDALEVWGPRPPAHGNGDTEVLEGYVGGGPGVGTPTADSDRFSLDGDSISGTSVWAYDIDTATVAPWVPHDAIVSAVETLFLPDGYSLDPATRSRIDVDGTMARDLGVASPTAPLWGPGDELLFTLDPILDGVMLDPLGASSAAPPIDGGEIMHLVYTAAAGLSIDYLYHGGHYWDTDFDLKGTFGYESEDVDALEAVGTLTGMDILLPEPSALSLLLPVLAGVARRRRYRYV